MENNFADNKRWSREISVLGFALVCPDNELQYTLVAEINLIYLNGLCYRNRLQLLDFCYCVFSLLISLKIQRFLLLIS